METIFYLSVILVLFSEVIDFARRKDIYSLIDKIRANKDHSKATGELYKRDRGLDENERSLAKQLELTSIFSILVVLAGLGTFQWKIFLVILLIVVIPNKIHFVKTFERIIIIALLIFVIVNKYNYRIMI